MITVCGGSGVVKVVLESLAPVTRPEMTSGVLVTGVLEFSGTCVGLASIRQAVTNKRVSNFGSILT